MNSWFARPVVEVTFKSEWRKKLEADQAAERIYAKPMPKVLPESDSKRIRKPRPRKVQTDFCAGCGDPIRSDNSIGYCYTKCATHIFRAVLAKGERPTCKMCGTTINRGNTYGLCEKHAKNERQKAWLRRRKLATA